MYGRYVQGQIKYTVAESKPKRGTSIVGVECSLPSRANKSGGTCPSLSSVPPPVLPLRPHPIQRIGALLANCPHNTHGIIGPLSAR